MVFIFNSLVCYAFGTRTITALAGSRPHILLNRWRDKCMLSLRESHYAVPADRQEWGTPAAHRAAGQADNRQQTAGIFYCRLLSVVCRLISYD